mgnify:CR=1 FL=1
MRSLPFNKFQAGFSLIELMVALVLGLFIVGGVMVVFVSSSHSFSFNESLSRAQESGRFALEIIARDLRNAGYKGDCFSNVKSLLDTSSADYHRAIDAYDLNDSLKGWSDEAGAFFNGTLQDYRANTDLLLVKHAATASTAELSEDISSTDISFPITGGEGSGTLLVFSDAGGCDLFQNTAAQNASSLERGRDGQSINNRGQSLSHGYRSGGSTRITRFISSLFYIGSSDRSASISALRAVSYNNGIANDQELVEGVTGMNLHYALEPVAGEALDYTVTTAQVTAADRWDEVIAVRVNLTVAVQGIQSLPHQFSTTVALRNRLP